jgi:hypothetical protein
MKRPANHLCCCDYWQQSQRKARDRVESPDRYRRYPQSRQVACNSLAYLSVAPVPVASGHTATDFSYSWGDLTNNESVGPGRITQCLTVREGGVTTWHGEAQWHV